MNVHQPIEPPAELHYDTPDFRVVRPGGYVICAVSGRHIPLEGLRYWSVERQEAYASAEEATVRLTAKR